ncbi:class I SAM-dependent methyltransferase [Lacticaseibacillus absianus]|uniref:class I SAM-dependent methyltransferase n=1 Tax=Lacticaseibacillus absianus TaxID=2729623 RepID=UPI0015CEEC2E|nr:class I SAM-dependent methyltransferase [Lacticaseibacillus absianus]
MAKPKYNTWIRRKRIIIFLVISLSILLGAGVLASQSRYFWLLGLLSLPFIYITVVLSVTYYQFSSNGGGYQAKIHTLVASQLRQDHKHVLDIGTGSGALAIEIAQQDSHVAVTGIDSWSKNWEYSKQQCERNAQLMGVSEQTRFQKASAAKLPFSDNSFDAVVSVLTFHEVTSVQNKVALINEALRVLSPNGEFVFLDLFRNDSIFGDLSTLTATFNASTVQILPLEDCLQLPAILRSKHALYYAAIIKGVK